MVAIGIDLGTTNSAIARMEKGDPVIKKSTTGSTQTDTTPSCVSYNKKQTSYVGRRAYRILNSERLTAFRKNDKSHINTFPFSKKVFIALIFFTTFFSNKWRNGVDETYRIILI